MKISRLVFVDILIFVPMLLLYFVFQSGDPPGLMYDHTHFFNRDLITKTGLQYNKTIQDALIRQFGKKAKGIFKLAEDGKKFQTPRNALKDGAIRLVFHNDLQSEDYHYIRFKKSNEDNYYEIVLRTGPFEEVQVWKMGDGNEQRLDKHLIPLGQNRVNMLQIVFIDDYLFIFLNRGLTYFRKIDFASQSGQITCDFDLKRPEKSKFLIRAVTFTEPMKKKILNLLRPEKPLAKH